MEWLKEVDINQHRPSLAISLSQDEGGKHAEDEQFKIEFKAEYDAFMKRRQALEVNMTKPTHFCGVSVLNQFKTR